VKTKDKILVGHNLDWMVGTGLIVVNKRNVTKTGRIWGTTWTSKYGSITESEEGREFPGGGINEKGLVIVGEMLESAEYPDADERAPLTDLQWVQYMLDMCASVDDVLAQNKIVRIDKNQFKGHYMVTDKTGDCASLEWLGGKLVVSRGDKMPVKLMVNEVYATCIKDGDDYSKRFGVGKKLLEAFNDTTPANTLDYALKLVDTLKYWDVNGTKHSELNMWQSIWDISEGRLYVRTKENFKIRYIDFDDVSFDCGDPVVMIDINSSDTGNLATKMKPYTYLDNKKCVEKTLKALEAYDEGPFSADLIEEIASYPETKTSCKTSESKPDSAESITTDTLSGNNVDSTTGAKTDIIPNSETNTYDSGSTNTTYVKSIECIKLVFHENFREGATIILSSLNGQVIRSVTASKPITYLKTNGLEVGMYMCTVIYGNQETHTSKVLVY
jgi:choloylglycine hydrolase